MHAKIIYVYYKPNLAPTLKILIHLDYKTKMIFYVLFFRWPLKIDEKSIK